MTKQSMAYLVEALQVAGYLRSVPDPSDGRARIVCLTARGDAVLAALVAVSAEAEAGVAERIGDRRVARLRRALERWVAASEGTG